MGETSCGTIRITRVDAGVNRLQNYTIVVDGEDAGRIGSGETLSILAVPGSHAVYVRIDWCRSPILEVDVMPGRCVAMTCRPAAQAFSLLFWLTIGHKRYIELSLTGSDA